jgi:hypothetical protein
MTVTSATATSTTAAAQPSSSAEQTNGPAPAALEQQALDVAVYAPGDPTACRLPEVAAPTDTATSARVFFGCTPASGPVLPAVPARIVTVAPGSDPKAAALRALLAGPTSAEQSAGYLSNFGAASRDVEFALKTFDNGLVVVDLDPAIRKVQFIFVSNMDAAQIVATLGQFPDVKRVTILVGGQLLCQVVEQC